MSKNTDRKSLLIVGVKPSTIAMFEGVLAAVVGFSVAVLFSLRATIQLSQETSSVLTGMTFGVATGIVSIIVVPLIYFALGWLIGWLHGAIFNAIVKRTDGLVFYTKEK